MAQLVLSDGLVLFTWVAIVWGLSFIAIAVVARGWAWATGNLLWILEEYLALHRPTAIGVLSGALLVEFGIRLLGFPAKRLRGGEDATGLKAASEVERFVWPVGGFFYAVVVLMILLASARWNAAFGQGAGRGGGRVTLGDVLVFLALLGACIYMAATAP